MSAVYRRACGTAARRSLALLALACLACDGPPISVESEAHPPRPRPFALATLLASRSFQLIDVDPASGRALLRASDGGDLLWAAEEPRPIALAAGIGIDSIALFPGGEERLARVRVGGGTVQSRLVRVERDGQSSPLPIALAGARLAGRRQADAALDVAGTDAGGGEAVFALSTTNRLAERIAEFPPGFVVSAISADGGSIALRRSVHPDADEVYLLRRDTGELRLLLPSGEDARFQPEAFDRSADSLLLRTDEGDDLTRLEWLDLDSGARRALPSPLHTAGERRSVCDLVDATLSGDGRRIAAIALCSGRRELRLLDAETGAPLPLPLLPADVRAVAGELGRDGELTFLTVASARTPRDLVAYPAAAPVPLPITWGLAPGIDPALLLEPTTISLASGGAVPLPVELWLPETGHPRRAEATATSTGALLWIESDLSPPAWGEFDGLFQFLAGRGIVVARFRLRGADGFGRAFRHAADGRLFESAGDDILAVRRELERRAGAPLRVALVGVGGWPGAVATAVAHAHSDSRVPESRPTVAPYAAVVAIGADDDPFRRLDEIALLAEPAKTWWTIRLGAPDSAAALAGRAATRGDTRTDVVPTVPFFAAAELDRAEVWRFLAPHFEPSRMLP